MSVIDQSNSQSSLAREYLTFRLGEEEYGIDILKVQEIRGYENPTRIANAPHFLKGVVNLRGTIVPIVDLRLRFGCSSAEYNSFTVSIILHIGQRTIGTVVDSVSDVMEIQAEAIRPAPEMSSAIDAAYILGLAQVGERMVVLLDIERMLMSSDMGLID
ncbi:MAG: chemotaxis protein CheW [Aquabacterium sp.]|uniref:chemotaxis protein CheW n=1 Tax=Aquabacterium sp. TaxID=1872578 RepID=UPI001B708ACD|nr:chemotaxis protein CheW [Aquabacterium sp.]MBP7132713.1 chemotaxis protein CheW [Aquabacterium sp.]MBP9063011.1 chemotaxis protein CheW [Aquabacterium sp.]